MPFNEPRECGVSEKTHFEADVRDSGASRQTERVLQKAQHRGRIGADIVAEQTGEEALFAGNIRPQRNSSCHLPTSPFEQECSMPNGLELSGPAMLLSTENRALAGSDAASC